MKCNFWIKIKKKIRKNDKKYFLVVFLLGFLIFWITSGFVEMAFHKKNNKVVFNGMKGTSYFSSFSGTDKWQDGVSLSACAATTGFCGLADGQTFSSPPTADLCSNTYLVPSAVTTNASTYTWYCNFGPPNPCPTADCSIIFDNYEACSANRSVPPAPATLTATCSSTGLISTSWSSVSGAIYALRIDTDWSLPHLLQLDSLTSTSRTYQGTVGKTYNVWVHAIVGGVWSDARSTTVTCPVTYSCTGTRPANTSVHSGDTTGLTANTSWAYSATNTSRKCQYYCNSGYTWNGSLCHLNAFCGAADGEAYCDAPTKDLCANNGSPSAVTSSGGNWIWTCSSVSGTTQDDESCSATIQTTGCGSPSNWREVNP
jgi:hypothetical protein